MPLICPGNDDLAAVSPTLFARFDTPAPAAYPSTVPAKAAE